jgi:hypothetical protein
MIKPTRLELVAVVALLSPWWIALVWAGIAVIPPFPMSDAHHTPSSRLASWRDIFELTSFIAATAAFPTAVFAGVFAYRQIKDAKAARIASIYMEINKTYNSDMMREARKTMMQIRRQYDTQHPGEDRLGTYLRTMFRQWKTHDPDSETFGRFNQCARILQFWEDVAILVKREYVDEAIIIDFHRSALNNARNNLGPYIREMRRADQDEHPGDATYRSTLNENALALFEAAAQPDLTLARDFAVLVEAADNRAD